MADRCNFLQMLSQRDTERGEREGGGKSWLWKKRAGYNRPAVNRTCRP